MAVGIAERSVFRGTLAMAPASQPCLRPAQWSKAAPDAVWQAYLRRKDKFTLPRDQALWEVSWSHCANPSFSGMHTDSSGFASVGTKLHWGRPEFFYQHALPFGVPCAKGCKGMRCGFTGWNPKGPRRLQDYDVEWYIAARYVTLTHPFPPVFRFKIPAWP